MENEKLGKINSLRNRHNQFLLEGVYCDNEPLQLDSEAVDGRAFRSGNRLMVAMTQSTAPTAEAALRVPGYRFVSADGLDDYHVEPQGGGLRVSVKRNAVALAIFERL